MPYTEEQLMSGLRKADAAGDVAAAKRFAQLIQEGRQKTTGPVDFSLREMASNIPGSAAKYGKDILSAITSPIDTGKAIGGLAQSVGNKLGRNAAELVQGVDMDANMPGRSEAAADAVGGAIKDRYGSIDAVKNTLQNDPVGMLADVSGLGMSTRIPGVARIAAAAEPINLTAKTIRSASKAVIPEKAAQRLYKSAAKFSTTLKPAKRESMVRTALEEGIMPTSRGVVKVQGRIDALNTQLDDLISVATDRGIEIPVNAIFQHLNEFRKTKGGVRLGNEADLKAIDKIAGEFHRSMKGRKTITPEELQFFKKEAYKDISWDAGHMMGSAIKEDTYKVMARGAKDAVAEVITDAPEINKLLGDLYELQPSLIRAANRIDNRNLISINAPLNIGAGGVVGGLPGMTVGAVVSALGNPKIKATIALTLNKLKQGDIKWIDANMSRPGVAVALALAGRGEALSDETSTNRQASQ